MDSHNSLRETRVQLRASYIDLTVRPIMDCEAILTMEFDLPVVILIAPNQDNGPILWHICKPTGQSLVRLVVRRELFIRHGSQGDVPITFFGRALPARLAEAADHVIWF